MLIVQQPVASLLEGCPHVDLVIPFQEKRFRRGPFYRLAVLWAVHRIGASTALYPCYSRTAVGDMLVCWSSAAERVGWESDVHHLSAAEKVRGDRQYTQLVPGRVPPQQHEIDRNLHFLREIGVAAASRQTRIWFARRARTDQISVARRIAILPGASFPIKKWGAGHFNELMQRLIEAALGEPIEFILCGQSGDAEGISIPQGDTANLVDLTGKTTLPELGSLFSNCRVVVGNDTGTMHLAIASGAPTVCIIGGGHYGRFMPYGDPVRNVFLNNPLPCYQCGWNCILEEPVCITRVEVARVAEACKRWL